MRIALCLAITLGWMLGASETQAQQLGPPHERSSENWRSLFPEPSPHPAYSHSVHPEARPPERPPSVIEEKVGTK